MELKTWISAIVLLCLIVVGLENLCCCATASRTSPPFFGWSSIELAHCHGKRSALSSHSLGGTYS